MGNRKLGRPTNQRKAMLRNQVTNLIWYGRIETTLDRAKEVRSIAEHMITIAMRECDNTVEVKKTTNNDKGQTVEITVVNDQPSRLAARRRVMSYLYRMPVLQGKDEEKEDFKIYSLDGCCWDKVIGYRSLIATLKEDKEALKRIAMRYLARESRSTVRDLYAIDCIMNG